MWARFSSAALCALLVISCGESASGPTGTSTNSGGSSGADASVGTGGSGDATASGGMASGGAPNGSGGAQSVVEAGTGSDSRTTPSDSGADDAAADGPACAPLQLDAGAASCVPDYLSLISTNACGATRATASRVVAGMRAGLRTCYNRALTQTPGIYGEITLFISVSPDGSIAGVTSRSEGTLPDSVASCMRARANSAMFDPATGPTTFAITLAAGCPPASDAMP